MKTILIILLGICVLGIMNPPPAPATCQTPSEAEKLPEEDPPKMGRYQIQSIYLGMSFKELQLAKPRMVVRPVIESGVIREYHAEYLTPNEQFFMLLTFKGQLYKLIYQKQFDAAVDSQELQDILIEKYGDPETTIETPSSTKVFELCWGQCQMIQDGIFCQNQETESLYTYFSAGLGITRTEFFVVLNDSELYNRNEKEFAERKHTKQMLPSTQALDHLKL